MVEPVPSLLTTFVPPRSMPEPLGRQHFEQVLATYNPPSRVAQATAARAAAGGGASGDDSIRLLAAVMNQMLARSVEHVDAA